MGKPKASDDQIIELARNGMSNRQISDEVGIKYAGTFHDRCQRIRKENGIPDWSGVMGRPPGSKDSVKRKLAQRPEPAPVPIMRPEPKLVEITKHRTDITPFPFGPNEQIYYDNRACTTILVNREKAMLRRNADGKSITVTAEEYILEPEKFRTDGEKPRQKPTERPLKIDLEMDDNTGSMADLGQPFKEVDYIDDGVRPTLFGKIKNFVARWRGRI